MAKSATSSGYFTSLFVGGLVLVGLGLMLTFAPDQAPDPLVGTGPVIFLAGVVALTGCCVVGALGDRDAPAPAPAQPRIVAGWYPDGTAEGTERYYDGAAWTEHVRQRQT